MLWGIEFHVLALWYKKDCCSLVLFTSGIVNMKEVEQQVERECLTLDFVKYWCRLQGFHLWYNYTLFYQLHIGKVCQFHNLLAGS